MHDTDGNLIPDELEGQDLDENGDPIVHSDDDFDTSDEYRGDR